MKTARERPGRAFFWQGLLILLPVAVMAAIGLRAILRDKAAVEQQARQRAAEILRQLAPEVGRRVAAEQARFQEAGLQWFAEQRQRLREAGGAGAGEEPGSGVVFGRMEDAFGAEGAGTNVRVPGGAPGPRGAAFDDWQAAYPDLQPGQVFPAQAWLAGDRLLPWGAGEDLSPPRWLLALSEEQRRAWDAVRQAEWPGANTQTNSTGLETALRHFLELNPSEEARANAEWVRLETGPGRAPAKRLESFARTNRAVAAECGVPLSNLALAEALQRAGSGPELGSVLDALVDESLEAPSLLLPEVLNRATSAVGRLPQGKELLDCAAKLWSAQARLARILSAARQNGRGLFRETTNFWVEAEQRRWFCTVETGSGPMRAPPARGTTPLATNRLAGICTYPKALLERAFARAIRAAPLTIPGYFGLTAEIDGEPLELAPARATRLIIRLITDGQTQVLEGEPSQPASSRPGRSEPARVLAEAHDCLAWPGAALPAQPGSGNPLPLSGADPETSARSGRPQFTLRLCLADPARLFAEQRQRTFMFGGLIVASMLAALVGLVAARRAFYRQVLLSQLKSNFVSSVSHELRAPIASVRLMAESLERGKIAEPARQQEYFRFIGQECRRLSALIENVLDFSRIEQGRKQYEFEPTNLVALARQTVKLMETYGTERQVKLELVIPEALESALSTRPVLDGKAIQQALVNLIDNAMKHSPKGQTVTVGLGVRNAECGVRRTEVGVRRTEDGGPRTEEDIDRGSAIEPPANGLRPPTLILWVEDHGDGIPAEDQERIFERFYRRGSELRRETQGVGIGLSIVKHLVEAHGGRVVVRSALGQGSRFTIELPGWGAQADKGKTWNGY